MKFLFIAFFFINTLANAQGPWTKEKNKTFLQLGFSGIFYDEVEYNGNTIKTNRNNADITTQLYAEYGITNKLEATIILPYKTVSYKSNTTNITTSLSGLGNVGLGLKYQLKNTAVKWSGGLLLTLNTIKKNATVGLRTGFDAATILPYLSVGFSQKKWYGYANAGYGYMSNDYSDFFKLYVETGYNIGKQTLLIALLDVRTPISKESFYLTDNSNYALTANNLDRQSYLGAGLKVNREFASNKFGINLSYIGAFLLDNTPSQGSINLGIYTKF